VLIVALNKEKGIKLTLESKKTLDEPVLMAHVNELACDSRILFHLNCSRKDYS
jgi:hypothetical protein